MHDHVHLATAGKVTGHASATLSVGRLGDRSRWRPTARAATSADAVKTFVDANIQITPQTATNPVGTNHTFTAHVNVNDGHGRLRERARRDGRSRSRSRPARGTFAAANPCTTVGATGLLHGDHLVLDDGRVDDQARRTTVAVGGVLADADDGDGSGGDWPRRDEDVGRRARIAIAPNATNEVGQPHTFTVTLEKDTAPARSCRLRVSTWTVTLTDSNGAAHASADRHLHDAGANTNANGQCTITFTSNTAGQGDRARVGDAVDRRAARSTVATDGVAPNSARRGEDVRGREHPDHAADGDQPGRERTTR